MAIPITPDFISIFVYFFIFSTMIITFIIMMIFLFGCIIKRFIYNFPHFWCLIEDILGWQQDMIHFSPFFAFSSYFYFSIEKFEFFYSLLSHKEENMENELHVLVDGLNEQKSKNLFFVETYYGFVWKTINLIKIESICTENSFLLEKHRKLREIFKYLGFGL